ncbi:alpha-L-fucosidase [Zhouia sp. PK063]|uniref:alpha-L-fucosidase n=1 Tax=Zhouia sp. PK063 TaxID=3373602 RepID=UPI00379DC1B8
MKNKTITTFFTLCCLFISAFTFAQKAPKQLVELQQDFIDLRFGMFIHYNIPTYMEDDWPDPDASPEIFNPDSLDCEQWAKAAKSANMTYGCLTTKHHSGFCIWDTKTTDYSVMSSPLHKDVVKEYVNAFRKEGLKVMLYFSILDIHHKIRPGLITPEKVQMIKNQLTELLTNYGKIDALIIDGWDAPWSRISYDDVPFEELYRLIKSIQPNCLVMDLNAAKYPKDALFYTDIKSYEQNAGQHIAKDENILPALSCYPIQQNWFWKPWFPQQPVKDAEKLVKENIIPLNEAHCNFILNVAPNRHGKIDANALAALKKIGELWKNKGPMTKLKGNYDAPIISHNLAKFKPSYSSWSNDMNIMDFANDDDFSSSWQSHRDIKNPWWEVDLGQEKAFNMISITENNSNITSYTIEYFLNNKWHKLLDGNNNGKVKIHRFKRVYGNKVKITITGAKNTPSIAEFGVYNERD